MLCVHRRAARTLELRQQPVPPCGPLLAPLSLSLSLARSLARSYLTIAIATATPPPRPWPRISGEGRPWHARRRAFTAALGPAGCSGYHLRTSSWSSLRNWRWRLRSARRVTRAPAKQAPRTRPAYALHTSCTLHTHALDLRASQRADLLSHRLLQAPAHSSQRCFQGEVAPRPTTPK